MGGGGGALIRAAAKAVPPLQLLLEIHLVSIHIQRGPVIGLEGNDKVAAGKSRLFVGVGWGYASLDWSATLALFPKWQVAQCGTSMEYLLLPPPPPSPNFIRPTSPLFVSRF